MEFLVSGAHGLIVLIRCQRLPVFSVVDLGRRLEDSQNGINRATSDHYGYSYNYSTKGTVYKAPRIPSNLRDRISDSLGILTDPKKIPFSVFAHETA